RLSVRRPRNRSVAGASPRERDDAVAVRRQRAGERATEESGATCDHDGPGHTRPPGYMNPERPGSIPSENPVHDAGADVERVSAKPRGLDSTVPRQDIQLRPRNRISHAEADAEPRVDVVPDRDLRPHDRNHAAQAAVAGAAAERVQYTIGIFRPLQP